MKCWTVHLHHFRICVMTSTLPELCTHDSGNPPAVKLHLVSKGELFHVGLQASHACMVSDYMVGVTEGAGNILLFYQYMLSTTSSSVQGWSPPASILYLSHLKRFVWWDNLVVSGCWVSKQTDNHSCRLINWIKIMCCISLLSLNGINLFADDTQHQTVCMLCIMHLLPYP